MEMLRAEGVETTTSSSVPIVRKRPLRVLLVNLMPTKILTEGQIARLLGVHDASVALTLCIPDSYRPKTASPWHIEAFYERFEKVRHRRFDGLIVTGAPVETLPFEQVTYWDDLVEIFDWSRTHVRRSLFICWAAQAALYHFHGVPKHRLEQKISGVYAHHVVDPGHPLFRDLGASFNVPVSRRTEVRSADLPAGLGLEVLAVSDQAGVCLVEDGPRNATYMFNHLEYDTDTLAREFWRDAAQDVPVELPKNYFPNDDPTSAPVNSWRHSAHAFFANWLRILERQGPETATEDPLLDWLLAERRLLTVAGRSFSDFMICATDHLNTLPQLLRRLAEMQVSPQAVKVHEPNAHEVRIELRVGETQEREARKIARGLLRHECVYQVSYRTSSGSGCILSHRGRRRHADQSHADVPILKSA
jgi:homoserine O-succinyltransferase